MKNSKIPTPFKSIFDSKQVEPNIKYFVFSEGAVTEQKYFRGLKNHKREIEIETLINIIPIHCDEINPKKIVDEVVENIEKYIEFDEIHDNDILLFIFDRDRKSFTEEQFNYVKSFNNTLVNFEYCDSKHTENRVVVGLSNSSFEFWLMCHYLSSSLSSEEIEKIRLNEVIKKKSYSKRKISTDIGVNVGNFDFIRFATKCGGDNKSDYGILIRKAIQYSKSDFLTTLLPRLESKVGTNLGIIIEEMLK